MLPTMREEEDRLDREFEKEFDGISVLWDRIDLLRRTLLEKRAALDDSSNFRSALDLLAAKGISDARAAFVLVRRGYALACLGPLRSALEAVDLMQYFRLNPTEVELWHIEDERFATLGWVGKNLPEDLTPTYDFLAYGMHANWWFIPSMLSCSDLVAERNYEIVPGPVRNRLYAPMLALSSVHQALRGLGELHQHSPLIVGQP